MTQENIGDVVKVEGISSPEEKPKAPTPSPEEELIALRQQFEEATKKLADIQEEAKAHQRVASKKEEELQKAKELKSLVEGIGERLDLHESLIAELGDKGIGEPEGEPSQPFSKRVEGMRLQRQRDSFAKRSTEIDGEITELLKDAGFSKDSPEMEDVRFRWNTGVRYGDVAALEDALRKTKGMVEKANPKEPKKVTKTEEGKMETEEERIDRLAEEKARKMLEEKGLLSTEAGSPSATSKSYTNIRDAYIKDPDNPVIRKRYEEARKERGI